MNESVTLKSGRELVLNVAPFVTGRKLLKVVSAELRTVEVEIGGKLDLNADVLKMLGDPKALNTVKNVFCQLLSSDAVEAAFFECATRCTLDGQRIVRDTFESADARPDFLPVAWEVVRYNLTPFFAGLSLSSSASPEATTSAPA